MLIRIHIKNYKSLKDTKLLNVKPLTFLVGPNSSGKSSILQILLLLKQTIDSKDMENPLDSNGSWIQMGSYPEFIFNHDASEKLYISTEFILRKKKDNQYSKKDRYLKNISSFDYDTEATKINLNNNETCLDENTYIIQRNGAKKSYQLKIKTEKIKENIIKNVKPLKFYDFALILKIRPSEKDLRDIFTNTLNYKESVFLLEQQIRKIIYLGPLREHPHRYYSTSGKGPQDVGIKGEYSVDVLWYLKASGIKRNKIKLEQVEHWLKEFNFSLNTQLKPIGKSSIYNLFFKNPYSKKTINIADVGFGSSQTLPIIIQSIISPEGSTLLIEQPEIHLHPKAQAILGDLFISSVSKRDKSFIIETHSEHLLSRVRRRVAEGKISKENIAIYYFNQTSDGTEITEVTLDEDGQYVKYPDGFFEEEYNESFEHVKALQKKKKKRKQ